MNRIDEIRLNIYESYEDGDISEYEKDLLLEKCDIIEESTALQRHMKDKKTSVYAAFSDKIPEEKLGKYHQTTDAEKGIISDIGPEIAAYNRELKQLERARKGIKDKPNCSLAVKNILYKEIDYKISKIRDKIKIKQDHAMDFAKDLSASSKKRGDELAKEIAKEKKIREQQKKTIGNKKRNDKKDKELALKMTRGIEDKQVTKEALDAISPKKEEKKYTKK